MKCEHCGGSVITWDDASKCIMCGREPGVRLLTPEEANRIGRAQMRNQYAGIGKK